MIRRDSVPRQLTIVPFRADQAVAQGLVTREQLRSAAWRRLFHGVYVEAASFAANDHRMWCEAAALVLPSGGAISETSAAFLWGATGPRRNAPVIVTVPHARRLRSRPRLAVRHGSVPAEDLASFAGLPVTSPARTAFDLGRRPDRRFAIMMLDAILHRKVVRLDRLRAFVASRSSWPGAAVVAARLEEAEPLTESPMETLLRLLITDAGLPRPVSQHDATTAGGRWLARVDLAYPELGIAIEYDGDHHRDPQTFQNDIARIRNLEEAGWLVLRFTANDVLRQPARTVRSIATARRRRSAEGGAWRP
ncbi:hypothetical protein J2S43_006166 [Catenuloplanes nepalensis]|uniref:DUF559 domain-containing protein n=1 Tax=Catenuloplanes nepalensis TaxID=587533 RepID=A0ABT9N1T4_9ACTN|nr:DUF559 domain-containing protein [Catenuloplanes nepalensis]MDP9797654.1 hypothetical protein [Catenuloplanes nepalensis]